MTQKFVKLQFSSSHIHIHLCFPYCHIFTKAHTQREKEREREGRRERVQQCWLGGSGKKISRGEEDEFAMHSMACASYHAFSQSPHRDCSSINITYHNNNKNTSRLKSSKQSTPLLLSSLGNRSPSYNTLVFEAARLLGPPARFEASKLKVVLLGQETDKYKEIVPRTYTLSHCDLTANLTLTISNVIQLDQLKGWYSKDDVVAEWKEVKGNMYLDVHCYVSGPNLLLDLAAEFRYHIFSKELPLVLKAVMHGDSLLFTEHQELMDALVQVYFHSSLKKYNRVECWGPLKDAAQGRRGDQINGLLNAGTEDSSHPPKIWGSPKSIFQALFAFLL